MFCSLGALALSGRLNVDRANADDLVGPRDPVAVLGWLVSRQTELTDPDGAVDSEFAGMPPRIKVETTSEPVGIVHQSPVGLLDVPSEVTCAGMNGRMNKVADTCYAFWVGASLHILRRPALCDQKALRKYLLEKTQHPILGGFGKFPGDLPDLYHSYLGLAALSLAGGEQVKELDGGMCLSKSALVRLPTLWDQWDKK